MIMIGGVPPGAHRLALNLSFSALATVVTFAQNAPVLKHHKRPVCSAEAAAAYASADIAVDLTVDEHGMAKDVVVNDPTKERYFYGSIWQIVPTLRFKPGKVNGKPAAFPGQHIAFSFACMPPRAPRRSVYAAAPALSIPPINLGGGVGFEKYMIFGGSGHQTYLGCLNCNQLSPDSVSNQYGSYGSSFSSTSIFNKYGQFGSPYSNLSMCNPYASDPPVIVTKAGVFYGRLTVNTINMERTRNPDWQNFAEKVCSSE